MLWGEAGESKSIEITEIPLATVSEPVGPNVLSGQLEICPDLTVICVTKHSMPIKINDKDFCFMIFTVRHVFRPITPNA